MPIICISNNVSGDAVIPDPGAALDKTVALKMAFRSNMCMWHKAITVT